MKRVYYILNLIIFVFVAQLLGCKKDPPSYPVGSNSYVNSWILDSLRRYYLWNESLPKKINMDQEPQLFFRSLLHANDRFSYMVDPADPSSFPKSNRSQFGFDYSTLSSADGKLVFGVIKYVYNDSPASRNGLKRGDYISRINGQQLTTANAVVLQNDLLTGDKGQLTLAALENNSLRDIQTVDLSRGMLLEQPILREIFHLNAKTIGYLYINDFSRGIAQSAMSDFTVFKNEQIDALLVDLRYNPGGQVAEAAGIAGLISGLPFNTAFITYTGNKNGGRKTESIGQSASGDGTLHYNQMLESGLKLKEVYILTSPTTASAAEILINNLKPYAHVITIGEKTRGKDEASFVIKDMRPTKTIAWEIHPIIYKLSNALGSGDYATGIVPQYHVNELEALPLKVLPSLDDPLIQRAIALIGGSKSLNKRGASKQSSVSPLRILTDSKREQTYQEILQINN
ncbi:S41 family peptidase [Sphingobacterium sp. BIGb0165]|uniref:S41 family peptidase n=1 Tax=Sphingobacterium sp. BIGb0165 TaxID=2940615 RepID=UPI00216A4ACD|nr:S41 family peptidase [Sphingobacterium sp. BIGb0165]MCS4224066.1 C-terminal processing protease CtpA/Prc [Sphingobacterium sp. BIGb0165]